MNLNANVNANVIVDADCKHGESEMRQKSQLHAQQL